MLNSLFPNVLNAFLATIFGVFFKYNGKSIELNEEHKACLCDQLEKNKFQFDWLNKEVQILEDLEKVVTGETSG